MHLLVTLMAASSLYEEVHAESVSRRIVQEHPSRQAFADLIKKESQCNVATWQLPTQSQNAVSCLVKHEARTFAS